MADEWISTLLTIFYNELMEFIVIGIVVGDISLQIKGLYLCLNNFLLVQILLFLLLFGCPEGVSNGNHTFKNRRE